LEEYQDDGAKKGRSKWMLWAVIGVVAVIVVVVIVTQLGGGQSSASGLTVDDLSAIVNQQSTSIQGFTTWKATATEDLANINTKQQQILSQLSGITNPKDWTADMNKLKADFTALQASWEATGETLDSTITGINATIEEAVASVNITMEDVNQAIEDAMVGINMTFPRYAVVSGMEEKLTGIYVDVTVFGTGDFPVVVSLYGDYLDEDEVIVRPHMDYAIVADYPFYDLVETTVGNETFYYINRTRWDFVITPGDVWTMGDTIQLKVIGDAPVSYAFAVVGDSWAKAEEEW